MTFSFSLFFSLLIPETFGQIFVNYKVRGRWQALLSKLYVYPCKSSINVVILYIKLKLKFRWFALQQ